MIFLISEPLDVVEVDSTPFLTLYSSISVTDVEREGIDAAHCKRVVARYERAAEMSSFAYCD